MPTERHVLLILMETLDFGHTYNPLLGLWTQPGSGHTRPVAALDKVHSGPNAVIRLVLAAQQGKLEQFPAAEVLGGLRALQVTVAGPRRGCSRWYAEEEQPVDTNASFFTCLNLLVLNASYREHLDAPSLKTLDSLLRDFEHWFEREAQDNKVHYPNKYLGDLVCLWLLKEHFGSDLEPWTPVLEKAGIYWRDQHWGWGEHMSDPYAIILLDELSCLLLFARYLPEGLRSLYKELFDELILLEDFYDGGPRVPTIRSYAFQGQDTRPHYRKKIVPCDEVNPMKFSMQLPPPPPPYPLWADSP